MAQALALVEHEQAVPGVQPGHLGQVAPRAGAPDPDEPARIMAVGVAHDVDAAVVQTVEQGVDALRRTVARAWLWMRAGRSGGLR
ncbi:MAG: hypothetical protein R3F60_14670 [bacterium]